MPIRGMHNEKAVLPREVVASTTLASMPAAPITPAKEMAMGATRMASQLLKAVPRHLRALSRSSERQPISDATSSINPEELRKPKVTDPAGVETDGASRLKRLETLGTRMSTE